MKAKFVSESLNKREEIIKIQEAYEPKDLKRVRDFGIKSGGDFQKEIALAQRMANTLTNMDKAIGRAEAAAEVYGEQNEIVEIFYKKAKELGFTGPPPGERLKGGIKLGSKLPKEQQYKRDRTSGFRTSNYRRSTAWRGNPILPLGKVDLRSGDSPMFNVYDTWLDDNSTTVEVWRDNKGINTSYIDVKEPKTPATTGLSSILKPKSREEIEKSKRSFFNYKVIFTSGSTPLQEIGEKQDFYHDQNGNHIGYWEMVDYVSLENLKELILPYGKKINGYVYK